jgi:putative ATP-dependent endonuclease of OLD family
VVAFDAHTAFIGGNGAGKSSILKAIERFYSTTKMLDIDDYFGRDQSLTVEIEVTFSDLTAEELDVFHSRVRDDQLTVTRIFDATPTSGRYFGSVPRNPDFAAIRAIPAAIAKRAAYTALSATAGYEDLTAATSVAQVDEGMIKWENDHPDKLTLGADDGQFFGFQNASRGALQRFTSFVFVPAVRDASADAADAKNSAIGRLLELIVRSSILQRTDIAKFKEDVNLKFRELTSPENMPELGQLAGKLTTDLKELYADAAVGLVWQDAQDMQVPLPNADVVLSDDGFGGPVDRQGHGLQRAFIFTLLQQLARASVDVTKAGPPAGDQGGADDPPKQALAPSLILAIEEPELYQHPTKQRHFSEVLRALSNGTLPGADGRTQVAFASHSPMFVSIPHVDEIRFLRRVGCEGYDFKQCELRALDLATVASKLETALQKPVGSFTAASLAPRLHILGPELAEGFFADAVVLVEGRSDKAALLGAAAAMNQSFGRAGIAVISAEGKPNLDRPLLIFKELGIPTYVIWDCDGDKKGGSPEQNLCLLRVLDPDADHKAPPTETAVTATYAHFAGTLEETLKAELTEPVFHAALTSACGHFETNVGRDAQKSPEVMKRLLLDANEAGHSSTTLENIIRTIWLTLKGVALP